MRRWSVHRILAWGLLVLTAFLAFACVMSYRREWSYQDGINRSCVIHYGHLRFSRYEMPKPNELQCVPDTPPDVEKYLAMRYGQNLSSQGRYYACWDRLTEVLSSRWLWLPPWYQRLCVARHRDNDGGGGGIEAWMQPGVCEHNFPNAAEAAWCVEHRHTVALQTPLVACALISAVVWWPLVAQRYRSHKWRRQGRCLTCGYNLTGNVSGRCPECGEATGKERT